MNLDGRNMVISYYFFSETGELTSIFNYRIESSGRLIFLGKFLYADMEIFHILVENIPSIEDSLNRISGNGEHINHVLLRVEETLNAATRQIKLPHGVKKIVFLIHNMATWDSISEVCEKIKENNKFELIIISIPRRFPGSAYFDYEQLNHQELEKKGIEHIRFQNADYENNLRLLKLINPDAIFRQSPWDADIPKEFSTEALSFTNLFYIPYYGFNIVENFEGSSIDQQSDQIFHRTCVHIYGESPVIKQIAQENSFLGSKNIVVTGHPKLERIRADDVQPIWPIQQIQQGKSVKIIWAPHHSFTGDNWLSFGNFREVYQDVLNWVRQNTHVEIVLRPHPALFSQLVGMNLLSQDDVEHFIKEWSELPNTSISCESSYSSLFAASDIMLTDGISFLVEYMFYWEKPLLFLENPNHAAFNSIGKKVEQAVYRISNIADAQKFVSSFLATGMDPKRNLRHELLREILPQGRGAAQRILQDLEKLFFS